MEEMTREKMTRQEYLIKRAEAINKIQDAIIEAEEWFPADKFSKISKMLIDIKVENSTAR